MRNFLKQLLSFMLRASISVVMLLILFKRIDVSKILSIIRSTRPGYLLVGLFFFIITYALCFVRWRILLNSVDIRLPFRRLFASFSGSLFFNLFLPATIGGDVMRVMDLGAHTKRAKEVAATVLLDRLSGFVGMVLTAFLAGILGWQYVEKCDVLIPALFICVLIFALVFILFTKRTFNKIARLIPSKPLRQRIDNIHSEIFDFRQDPVVLLKAVGLSFLLQMVYLICNYYVFLALNVDIKIVYVLIFIPLINLLTILPISIGGLGLRDMGSVFFFALVGIPKDAAVATSLLIFFLIVLLGVSGGLIYVFTLPNRWLQRHQ